MKLPRVPRVAPRAPDRVSLGLYTRRLAKAVLLSLSIYLYARVHGFDMEQLPLRTTGGAQENTGTSEASPKPILGVYHPVDPNTYDQVSPQNVKPQIREIANLTTDLYQLFIRMGYMDSAHFAWPPHDTPLRIDTEELALYGFNKDVVDLMQLLPFRIDSNVENWNFGTDQGEFILGGDFMPDLRRTLEEPERTERRNGYEYAQDLLDPFYAISFALPGIPEDRRDGDADERSWDHESGPYMKPTYLTMSGCGNHGSVMVFNTENYHMWLVDQLGGTNDPYFEEHPEYIKLGTPGTNDNDLHQHPSRLASEFLKDIINRFETLQWLPGGLYDADDEEYKKYRTFYEKAGWPHTFSLAEFHRLRTQSDADEEALREAWAPLNRVDSLLYLRTQRAEMRQRYANAKAKAANRALCKDDDEYMWAKEHVAQKHDRYEDPAAWWRSVRDARREHLGRQQAELERVRTRTGRFEGITDEQVVEFEKHFEDRIEELRRCVADESEEAWSDRILGEARAKAALVDGEIRRQYEEKKKYMNKGVWDKTQWRFFP